MMNVTISSAQQQSDSCDYHQVAWQASSRASSNYMNLNNDDVYYPPPKQPTHVTYPGCYGLPYQDHNYGAPPPPTPPLSPIPVVPISPAKINGLIDVVDAADSKDAKLATITDTINEVLSSTTSNKDSSTDLVNINPATLVVPALAAEEEVIDTAAAAVAAADDSVTRCVCDFTHDDGYMISCDHCLVWQHIDCVGIDRDCIPDSYYCEQCQPRAIDKKRAVLLQERRREQILALTMRQKRGPKKGKKLKDKQQQQQQQHHLVKTTKNKVKKFQKKLMIKSSSSSTATSATSANKWVKTDLKVIQASTIKTLKLPKKIKKLKENDSPKNEMKKIAAKVGGKVSVTEDEPLPVWDDDDDCSEDSYEIVSSNMYSGAVLEMFAGNKTYNGVKQHPDANNDCSPFDQLLVQLCKVRPNRKGIEVAHNVVNDQMLIEFKGEVMFREQFDKENNLLKNSSSSGGSTSQFHPFVLFYSKYDRCDLCIDATKYGSEARFLRRSCLPNAEVRHVVDSGLIHLLVYACKEISQGSEVTIPFDFDYRQCCEPVECACSRNNCSVTKYFKNRDQHPIIKQSSESTTTLTPPTQSTTVSVKKFPLNLVKVSRNNLTRVVGQKRSKSQEKSSEPEPPAPSIPATGTTNKRRATPLKPSTVTNQQDKTDLNKSINTSEDDEAGEESGNIELDVEETSTKTTTPPQQRTNKKMNREERKMEAIMKAFEIMEKREERRKEALARQQSHDSSSGATVGAGGSNETTVVSSTTTTTTTTTPVKKTRKNSSENNKKSAKRKSVEEKHIQVSESESTNVKDEQPIIKHEQKTVKSEPSASSSSQPSETPGVKLEQMDVGSTSCDDSQMICDTAIKQEPPTPAPATAPDEPPAVDSESTADDKQIKTEQTKLKGKKRRRSLPISRRRVTNRSQSASTDQLNTGESVVSTAPVSITPDPSIQAFRFPKTKKHMMNEWFSENDSGRSINGAAAAADGGGVEGVTAAAAAAGGGGGGGGNSSGVDEEEEQIFVKCINNSRIDNLSHLRRNSHNSGGNHGNVPILKLPTTHHYHHHHQSTTPVMTSSSAGGIGSAKKRWLRQAMNETDSGTSSPVLNGSASPNTIHSYISMNSPSHSPPTDFVTPLKKRRLARESISCEDGTLPLTPSTPSTSPVPETTATAASPVPEPSATVLPPTPNTPGDNLLLMNPCATMCYENTDNDQFENTKTITILNTSSGYTRNPSPVRSRNPSSSPALSLSPARSQLPSLSPARSQNPSLSPAQSQNPSLSPAQSQNPSSSPARSQNPSSSPSQSQNPSSSPAQSQNPSSSPAQSQNPSSSPAQSQNPARSQIQNSSPVNSTGSSVLRAIDSIWNEPRLTLPSETDSDVMHSSTTETECSSSDQQQGACTSTDEGQEVEAVCSSSVTVTSADSNSSDSTEHKQQTQQQCDTSTPGGATTRHSTDVDYCVTAATVTNSEQEVNSTVVDSVDESEESMITSSYGESQGFDIDDSAVQIASSSTDHSTAVDSSTTHYKLHVSSTTDLNYNKTTNNTVSTTTIQPAPSINQSSEAASVLPSTPPTRKKVSLLEYRKRMRDRGSTDRTSVERTSTDWTSIDRTSIDQSSVSNSRVEYSTPISIAVATTSTTSNCLTVVTGDVAVVNSNTRNTTPATMNIIPSVLPVATAAAAPPTPICLTPLQLPSNSQQDTSSSSSATQQGCSEKKDPWSTPTLVERIREQSLTGLSDRLKRDLRDFPPPPPPAPPISSIPVLTQKDDKRWSSAPVEKVREQSLTERLKREFGLEDVPDETDDEHKDGAQHLSLQNFQPPQMVMAPQLRPVNCMPVQPVPSNTASMFKPFQNFAAQNVGYSAAVTGSGNFSTQKTASSLPPVNPNYLQNNKNSYSSTATPVAAAAAAGRYKIPQSYTQNYQIPISQQTGIIKTGNYGNIYNTGKTPTGVPPPPPLPGSVQPPGGVDSSYRQSYVYNTPGVYQARTQQYNYSQSSSSYYKK